MRREGRGKGIEKERNEGRRNKKDRRTERKKEFRGKGGKEKIFFKSLLLALNQSG